MLMINLSIKIYYKFSSGITARFLFNLIIFCHNNNGDIMFKSINYYYKGYDVTNNNRLERLAMEYQNPYGYNLESNSKRVVDYDKKVTRTNQNYVKNKEFSGKR